MSWVESGFADLFLDSYWKYVQYNIVLVNTRGKRGSRSRNTLGAAERLHSASCALPEQRDAHLFPKHFSRASGGGGGGGRRRIGVRKLLAKPTSLELRQGVSMCTNTSSLSGCYTNMYIKFAYSTLSYQEILGTRSAIQSMTDPVLTCLKDGLWWQNNSVSYASPLRDVNTDCIDIKL